MSDAILAALARLEAGQAAIVSEQTRMRVDTLGKLEEITNAVSAIRDDIRVNMASTERVRQANEHTRDEVRALADGLADMWRQVKRLESEVRVLRGEAP